MEGIGLVSLKRLEDVLGRERADLRALARDARLHYRPFHLRDTLGEKKPRHIDNPLYDLKSVQRGIARHILSGWRAPHGMFGAIPHRTLLQNAQVHAHRSTLVTIDIQRCFPSIDNRLVFAAVKRLVGATETAELITQLTTVNFHLPQGAPSSPLLANMVMQPAFEELRDRGKDIGVSVSSWIDDFAFSGCRARELIDIAYSAFGKLGLRISRPKIHIFRSHREAMELTKLILNRRASLGRDRLTELRRAIFAASDAAVTEYELRRLRGRLQFARTISAIQGAALGRLAARKLPDVVVPGRATRPASRFEVVACGCGFGRRMKGHLAASDRGRTDPVA